MAIRHWWSSRTAFVGEMKFHHLIQKKNKIEYPDSDDEEQLNDVNSEDETVEEIDLFPILEYLLACPNTDVNIQNNAGDTALHIVSRQLHIGALEAMLCNLNSFDQAAVYCMLAFRLLDGKKKFRLNSFYG